MSPTQPTELDSGNEAQKTLLREAFQVIFKIPTQVVTELRDHTWQKQKPYFILSTCHCSAVETKYNGKGNSPRSSKEINLLLKAFQQIKTSGFLLTGILGRNTNSTLITSENRSENNFQLFKKEQHYLIPKTKIL